MCVLNHGSFLTFNILALGQKLLQYFDVSFVFHLPEVGHMIGRNMWKVYGVYIHLRAFVGFDIISITACHLSFLAFLFVFGLRGDFEGTRFKRIRVYCAGN